MNCFDELYKVYYASGINQSFDAMTLQEKLQVIQKSTALTQTEIAKRLGVSFVTLNSWWNGKSLPRPKKQAAIEDLYLDVTGQSVISPELLVGKKQALIKKSEQHSNILRSILENPDIHDRFILKLTYNSNRIEGSTLTEPDTAAVIFDNVALPNRSLTEQLEAKNHQTATDFLFQHIANDGIVDESFILKLHGILMNGIRSDAGTYRTHGVRILGINLPTANYQKIQELMPELLTEANQKIGDIFTIATLTHAKFERIHPFSDGNGRIGRLLMNAMFLVRNVAPAVIRQERKQFYYNALYRAQTTDDQSRLEDFLCDAVSEGFRILEREDEQP